MWVHGMDRSIFLRLASLVVAAATMASAWADQKSASAGIQQKTSPTTISVGAPDQHNLLIYQYGEVPYKPYVKELRTPGGIQVLRDSPWDHKHHHALMFAVGINGVDFWSENPHCGTQVHRQFSPRSGSTGDNNSFRENLDWISPEKQILAKEVRSISFQRGPAGGANLVTWKTQLEAPPGQASIKLSGSHYFGLGLRFVVSMDKGGKHFNSAGQDGEVVHGTEKLTRANWSAYSGNADGHPVTVAVFDCPHNPRRPAFMFTMTDPFVYISATLNLHREPLVVKAGAPLELCYGVAAWDGQVEPAKVEKLYQKWVKSVQNKEADKAEK